MNKTVDLSQPAAGTKVVDLSRPVPTKAEKIIRGLGVVALVAGTIAAGASAAHAHVTGAKSGTKST